MTIQLEISPESAARLAAEARARGIAPEEYAAAVLQDALASQSDSTEIRGHSMWFHANAPIPFERAQRDCPVFPQKALPVRVSTRDRTYNERYSAYPDSIVANILIRVGEAG